MPSKFTPVTLASLANETSFLSQLNANFSTLSTLLDTMVSRDGTSPNTLTANLDVNSKHLTNIANTYTQKLFINGTEVIAGSVSPVPVSEIATGTVSLPGLPVESDPNTGLYAPSADQLAIACGGVASQTWTATGTTIAGTQTVSGAATFGVGATITTGGLTISAGGINVTGTVTLPAFTIPNNSVCTTQAPGDNSTKPASTAFVTAAIAALPGAVTYSHVRGWRNTSDQTIGNAASTVVAFNAEDYDVNSELDITTNVGRFTAAATGYYAVTANVQISAGWAAGSEYAYLSIYKNGVEHTGGKVVWPVTVTNEIGLFVSSTVSLSAGDYLDIRVYQTSGGNASLKASTVKSYLIIDRIP